MPIKNQLERLLHGFRIHADGAVFIEPLILLGNNGRGTYNITYMCRVCKREVKNCEYRREYPIVDLSLREEYAKQRNNKTCDKS